MYENVMEHAIPLKKKSKQTQNWTEYTFLRTCWQRHDLQQLQDQVDPHNLGQKTEAYKMTGTKVTIEAGMYLVYLKLVWKR
jgi:hypothetical protein